MFHICVAFVLLFMAQSGVTEQFLFISGNVANHMDTQFGLILRRPEGGTGL